MKKVINISSFISLLLLMSLSGAVDTEISIENLSKKWILTEYSVGWFSEKPSKKEQNDYIHLSSNMTFNSISEGVFEKGTWRLKGNRIILSKNNEKKPLTFIVKEITNKELTLIIDDPSDSDAKYLNIHFKN